MVEWHRRVDLLLQTHLGNPPNSLQTHIYNPHDYRSQILKHCFSRHPHHRHMLRLQKRRPRRIAFDRERAVMRHAINLNRQPRRRAIEIEHK
jgi:hypothetical protein